MSDYCEPGALCFLFVIITHFLATLTSAVYVCFHDIEGNGFKKIIERFFIVLVSLTFPSPYRSCSITFVFLFCYNFSHVDYLTFPIEFHAQSFLRHEQGISSPALTLAYLFPFCSREYANTTTTPKRRKQRKAVRVTLMFRFSIPSNLSEPAYA